ncbi:hypothetical protein [Methanobacterium congolense]|uniref:ATP-binding protein n=1 Tax=Methanobacterium congolense TaxID=118062 RepID=A0A1D3L180_9EURY|nr:hypothetical protein [Methanobacterium congolense]SCG85190.1 putative protein [Methanobacterium congolense]
MENYKVTSSADNGSFVETRSYKKLYKILEDLKMHRGKIVHVLGAPGTGKSANIYFAVDELGFNVYDVELDIIDLEDSPKKLFNRILINLKREFHVNSRSDVYKKLQTFDAVLFADKFHDSHVLNDKTVGFSQWTNYNGFKSFYFYFLCFKEYLTHRNDFKGVNVVFQTAWRVYVKGEKKDLLTEFGPLSRLMVGVLSMLFEVVEISYSKDEIIQIVNKRFDVNGKTIESLIKRYGNKPRFICKALEKIDEDRDHN